METEKIMVRKNEKNIVVVTHNSRLQCFLDNLRQSENKIRFQNCCVVKLTILGQTVNVSLIHSGSLSDKDKMNDKPFYSTTPDQQKYIKFIPIVSPYGVPELKITNYDPDMVYNVYFVRHGTSEHNVGLSKQLNPFSNHFSPATAVHMTRDTSLTSTGKGPPEGAMASIYNDLKGKFIDYWFASDLVRTRQTLEFMLIAASKLDFQFKTSVSSVLPIVLPCSSEVAESGKKGNCDSSSGILSKMAQENYPSCTLDTLKTGPKCKNLNWEYYLEFYGQQMRSQNDSIYGTLFGKKTVRRHCRTTNMLAETLSIIEKEETKKHINDEAVKIHNEVNASQSRAESNRMIADREYITERDDRRQQTKSKALHTILFGGRKSHKRKNKKTKKIIR